MPAVHNAMMLIKPSSVAKTGASSTATINTAGSVDFTLCATLSLNNVFSSEYDNYMVFVRHVLNTATGVDMYLRFRSSGLDATGSNYVDQYLLAASTSVSGARTTSSVFVWGQSWGTQRDGSSIYLYGPALAQPTAMRSCAVIGESSARLRDDAGTHSLSAPYDGITLYPSSSTFSGRVAVYGMRQ